MSPEVDFDKLFAHRGGFSVAYKKLLAYAIVVIEMRSGPVAGGAVVARLDAKEVVNRAFERILTEDCSFQDGEAVYLQLRRHIDNAVRTIQKAPVKERAVAIGIDETSPTATAVGLLADENATSPAEAAELGEEDDSYKIVLNEAKAKSKPGSLESQFIDILIEGWRDRPDVCELLKITPEQYDALLKRVSRAAKTLKMEYLRR